MTRVFGAPAERLNDLLNIFIRVSKLQR